MKNMNHIRTIILTIMMLAGIEVPGFAQGDTGGRLLGSKLDLESFKSKSAVNSVDIDELGIMDLRLLRNAYAARQGYCFEDFLIRSAYLSTSWYEKKMLYWAEESEKPLTLKFSAKQNAFMERLKEREEQLRQQNYLTAVDGSKRINPKNILNIMQFEQMPDALIEKICQNGFAIVSEKHDQLFHLYEKNDYNNFPSFVTSDMYLQLFHIYFVRLLREVENEKLVPALTSFCRDMYKRLSEINDEDAHWNQAFYVVALRLLGDNTVKAPEKYQQLVDEELQLINGVQTSDSPLLGVEDFPYSLFKPRGSYTRSDKSAAYFRAMMWIQYAYACTSDIHQLGRFAQQADILNTDADIMRQYDNITSVISLLVGEPDDVSLADIARLRLESKDLKILSEKLTSLASSKTRITPKHLTTCMWKARVMPQRYNFDSEVLQELVDYDSKKSKRPFPMALDVMAAYGSETAENILFGELRQDKQWEGYAPTLEKVKSLMPELSKGKALYNMWMSALLELVKQPRKAPLFMTNRSWQKKSMNAALASYAGLKHDAMLYSKQPMGAECGGGVPEPVVVGYVEPAIDFYLKAKEILAEAVGMLAKADMMTEEMNNLTEQMNEQIQFLIDISKKELAGVTLKPEEYSSIEYIGSTYEYLTMQLLDVELGEPWDAMVSGPDKKIALISDIYTANAFNNPDKGIVEIGTGLGDDIYVVVEIDGYLYITRGAVLSFREFQTEGVDTRMTDEEWQEYLESHPRYGVPSWMKNIILNDTVPSDNEKIFYSSGC